MRLSVLAATLGVLLTLVVGCKAADSLATQEVVVHFAPGTSRAQHLAVLDTCGGLPHTSPEPISRTEVVGQDRTDVAFLVNPGSNTNLNRVFNCLAQDQFHGVVLGYELPGM